MGIFARLFGICRTKPPVDDGCWRFTDGSVELDLSKTHELDAKGGAVRLESGDLPLRVLVVHGDDGQFYAYQNKCTHVGRRLDPLPGSPHIQCCSVGKSTWEYEGGHISGPGEKSLTRFPVNREGDKLIIRITEQR